MDPLALDPNSLKFFFVTLVVGLWLYWLWKRRNLYRFAFNIPGYFGLPIIGIFGRIRAPKDVMSVISKIFIECKQHTVCIWLGLFPVLLTSEPDIIEKVLASPDLLNKAKSIYSSIEYVFNSGLVTSPAEKWQHNRRAINPSFNHKVLISFLPIFHKTSRNAIMVLDSMVGTGENKINDVMQRLSLGATFETIMGKVFNEHDKKDLDVMHSLVVIFETSVYMVLVSFLNLQSVFSWLRRLNQALRNLRHLIEELIVSRLQQSHERKIQEDLPQRSIGSSSTELSIKKTPNIFVDQVLHIYHKKEFSWEDVITESTTMFGASLETTANSIFSSIVMLAMHPDVQEKLYEEIVSVFPEKDFQMQFEDMEHLPFLEMVINETLRLTPPIPAIGRHVMKDTQLTKNLCLPKDLQIFISIFHLHRRTDIWGPNANKFNPDNFLPANLKDKHSHAFMPFSKGIRNCIGWRYALFFMKVALAGFVRHFRFTTTFKYEDLELVNLAALRYVVEPGIEIYRR